MKLYSNKQRWKIALLFLAIIMVGASLLFSNEIVKRVSEKERSRIVQWADAIRKKASLVNLTNKAFSELRDREREKVKLWAKATQELGKLQEDYTFFIELIQENKTIPVVLTDENATVISFNNFDFPADWDRKAQKDSAQNAILEWQKMHPPIQIDYYEGKKHKVFYRDSKKLFELEDKRDSLIHSFNNELINNDYLAPVVFVREGTREILATNLDEETTSDPEQLRKTINGMRNSNDSIVVNFEGIQKGIIYYADSPEIIYMKYFPVIQFFIIGLFLLIAYLIFSTFRKAEQNQVWAGMAKETAHQLGTPISSLMAWNQYLESTGVEKTTTIEIDKDIERLQVVADRFSKIGSGSKLKPEQVKPVVDRVVKYLKPRTSEKVYFNVEGNESLEAQLNAPLLEWVIENILKNAIDAMENAGTVSIDVTEVKNKVMIDISDTGKGIPKSKLKTVFRPGFTTKKRGWGLGLSLVKRIIETSHKGKVMVLKSEINVGTTFRIVLRK